MFTGIHFAWLGISLAFIVIMLFCSLKFKWSLKVVSIICLCIAIVSEVVKMLTHMTDSVSGGGQYLEVGELPLHLCSIQIFLILFITLTKNERAKQNVLNFMFPTMLAGAIVAILVPSIQMPFSAVRPYQYFVFHAMLIFFAIYLLCTKKIYIDWKVYLKNMACLFGVVMVAMWVNSILSFANTNFFYLVHPPISGLPLLNLDNGWLTYFVCILLVGFIAVSLVHLPFIIKDIINKKKGKNSTDSKVQDNEKQEENKTETQTNKKVKTKTSSA